MKFFVYPLSQDAMDDYLNACNEANRRYALLVEQERLLRAMVDDISEMDSLVASIQEFSSKMNVLFLLIQRPMKDGQQSLPIQRDKVNDLMSYFKDFGPVFDSFFSHFQLLNAPRQHNQSHETIRTQTLRLYHLKTRDKQTAPALEETVEPTISSSSVLAPKQ